MLLRRHVHDRRVRLEQASPVELKREVGGAEVVDAEGARSPRP